MIHDPNMPRFSDRGCEGPQCPSCGAYGCTCDPDDDPRSWRERMEEEIGEHEHDLERGF
jgi:hypothetical protein